MWAWIVARWQYISAIGTITGVTVTIIGYILKGLNTIRTNDLARNDDKLNSIVALLDDMKQSATRVEGKIDAHLVYHLEHKI